MKARLANGLEKPDISAVLPSDPAKKYVLGERERERERERESRLILNFKRILITVLTLRGRT
jgi:hypothetical protein